MTEKLYHFINIVVIVLKFELQKVREFKNGERYDFRIVIFIDDLDRCTPERALEILESIKTFF